MTSSKIAILASALSSDLRAAASTAREMEFRGLLVDAIMPAFDLTQLSGTGFREVNHLVRSNDLELAGIRAAIDPNGFTTTADIDRQLNRIEKALRAASELRCPLVTVDLRALPQAPTPAKSKPKITPEQAGLILIPSLESPQIEPVPTPKVDANALSLAQSAMIELGKLADRHGVRIAFSAALSSFATLTHIVNSARCPWFGFDLNPVDALRDDWDMDEILLQISPQLFHVQVKDALKGSDRRTQPALVGKGHANWKHLLYLLQDADYLGWLTVDPTEQTDRLSAARTAVAFLERF